MTYVELKELITADNRKETIEQCEVEIAQILSLVAVKCDRDAVRYILSQLNQAFGLTNKY